MSSRDRFETRRHVNINSYVSGGEFTSSLDSSQERPSTTSHPYYDQKHQLSSPIILGKGSQFPAREHAISVIER
jgi:hypothetical protein